MILHRPSEVYTIHDLTQAIRDIKPFMILQRPSEVHIIHDLTHAKQTIRGTYHS